MVPAGAAPAGTSNVIPDNSSTPPPAESKRAVAAPPPLDEPMADEEPGAAPLEGAAVEVAAAEDDMPLSDDGAALDDPPCAEDAPCADDASREADVAAALELADPDVELLDEDSEPVLLVQPSASAQAARETRDRRFIPCSMGIAGAALLDPTARCGNDRGHRGQSTLKGVRNQHAGPL